jgi:hypothetical protein
MTLEGARRVDEAIRDEWNARMHAHESRVAGYDDVLVDGDRQLAVWKRLGMLMLEAPAELVGSYTPDLGLFRWWWSGKENRLQLVPSRLDAAFAHAQKTDLRALLTRQLQLDSEADAEMLCRIAAHFANATAMLCQEQGDRLSYYAVFAAQTRAPIVPDLDIVRTLPPPAVSPAPARPSAAPAAVREPSRTLLLPLVHIGNGLMRRTFRERTRRGLLIVTVDTAREKARFFVTLIAATAEGELAAIDTTRDLLDAAGIMLGEDARSGNGRWRKLVVHLECAGEGAEIARCEVSA